LIGVQKRNGPSLSEYNESQALCAVRARSLDKGKDIGGESMPVRQPRYSKEEFARRGDEIYDRDIRPAVDRPENRGKTIAIDIETGDWEMDTDEMAACDRLEARHSDPQIWIVRVGSRSVRHFGMGRGRMIL
jgi:hypothetical protein